MTDKYIVSGIGTGDTGTSKFLEKLVEYNSDHIVLTPGRHVKLKSLFRKRDTVKFFVGVLYYVFHLIAFKVRCLLIADSEVILLHPQSIGLRSSMWLIRRNRKIKYYVLDGFLFCKQSYNYNSFEGGECTKCVYGKPDAHCKSFPVHCTDELHRKFRLCALSSSNVEFYFQNENHRKLHIPLMLERHSKVVGLETSDEFNGDLVPVANRGDYIVFHGDLVDAKGSKLLDMLIKGLPDIKFIVPCVDSNLERFPNVEMRDARWNTGLLDLVQNAAVVLCLSSWSAPIEGALTKSIRANGVVVVADVKHAFSSEFCDKAVLKISEVSPRKSCHDVQQLFKSYELQQQFMAESNRQLDALNLSSISQLLN